MKLYTYKGKNLEEIEEVEDAFSFLTFPDGQRHFRLEKEVEGKEVLVVTRIADADELFDLLMVNDVLTWNHNKVNLQISYLLGARMDRRIDKNQPFTLKIVTDILNEADFESITIIDPHSEVSVGLLRAEADLPQEALDSVLEDYPEDDTVIIAPDAGATKRVETLIHGRYTIIQGLKHRDMQTGNLSGFSVANPEAVKDKVCLIVDDICDGGGTFIGLAKVLRDAGATKVNLFVTHGIFSKGLPLEGIDDVRTTDSFYREEEWS